MSTVWEDAATADAATRTTANAITGGADANDEVNDEAYRFTWTDIDGNAKYSVGDTFQLQYDGDAAAIAYASTFDSGSYTLEVLHIPSGSSAGSLPRTF